ncbi:MAG TPA: hypothetical protein VME86_06540 [Acidobacteriaceae bacterium]|nr:hypothetical protein [Acidobacteriaceae bacterium]
MKIPARLLARIALLLPLLPAALLVAEQTTSGPWQMQTSNTTSGLRGIHAVNSQIAWASGTNGTVLRTTDGGQHWQRCATPPDAAKLDFRGVWAWNAKTAIVMSSGPGNLSRLYKTTDACTHWTLLFTNPDKDGFWDAMAFSDVKNGFLLGDPVHGRFALFLTLNGGKTWSRVNTKSLDADGGSIGAFAASNSAMILRGKYSPIFGTSGPGGPWLYTSELNCTMLMPIQECLSSLHFERKRLSMAGDSATSGIFALAESGENLVAVGGDYSKPDGTKGTAAAVTAWNGLSLVWVPAVQPPHGYRSSVAWDQTDDAWIAAGPNGSDISYDGKAWQPLDNGNWNALSLPWVVGPDGRIAHLDSHRLPDH